MRVLIGCTAPGKIAYVPFRSTKQDQLRITNADDLYANLPVGAARLEGKLARSGELDVDMTLVGRYEASAGSVTSAELVGPCDGATHIIRNVTVGAFDFHTAAQANVSGGASVLGAGAGGSSAAGQENLSRDGTQAACASAKLDDVDAPQNCSALVRVEVLALGKAPPPSCPDGSLWNEAKRGCVRTNVVTMVDCPAGATWDGSKCAASVDTNCGGGMHFVAGQGCMANIVAPAHPITVPTEPPSAAPGGMASTPAGDFWMGSPAGVGARRRLRRAPATSGARQRVRDGRHGGDRLGVRRVRERGAVRAAGHQCAAVLQLGAERPGESPGQLRRLEPGDGVLRVGGQALAERRRVGIRGARDGRADVPVG